LVAEDLGLTYPWVPDLLLADFGVQFQSELLQTDLTIQVGAPQVALEFLPKGRAPRDDEYISRDVEWYYLAEIKQPADTISEIAERHVAANGLILGSDGRATVEAAIQRTKRLLASLEIEGRSNA
jgi:hypothetical protein